MSPPSRARPAPSAPTDAPRASAGPRARIWPLTFVFAVLALVVVFANSPGRYITDLLIGDNHFSLFWNPGGILDAHRWLWDPMHGLGRTRNNFWPVPSATMWLVRSLGVPAIVAQRLWHAGLFVVAGMGMVALLRELRPRVGVAHVVAGLVFMFSPVAAVTLHSSYFFLGYAFAPWLTLMFVRGVREDRPWRWAAVFALLVFVPGNPNYASLLLAAFPIVPIAVYLVVVEGSVRWRRVFAWLGRAALLSALVSAAAIVTTRYGADVISGNVNRTELPRQVARNSSWAETLRGLGWWLTYFKSDEGVALYQFDRWFIWWPVALATFAAPVFAFVVIGWSRVRERLAFALVLLLGAGIMVGGFPPDSPTPFGRLLFSAFDQFPSLKGFRGTYKAGAVLAIGIAGLVGIGAGAVAGRLRGRRQVLGAVALTGVVLATALYPFWTGRLYREQESLESIPGYYRAATDWLDEQRGEGRVLVLPSTVEAIYLWGAAGDDIIDSLLDRPHIVRAQIDEQMGTAQSANLLAALDDSLSSGMYRPGSFAPIARRLGIRYVMVRNDLDWIRIRRPSPFDFGSLRADPDLRRVATFGSPMLVPEPAGVVPEPRPPVEIFEVEEAGPLARTAAGPALVVSGDGFAWPTLAVNGTLTEQGPVRYSGAMSARELATELGDGAPVVVTDTNVRRVISIPGATDLAIPLRPLGPRETVPHRQILDLFDRPGSQTVVYHPDATRITASSSGGLLGIPRPDSRPANAFDGNPATNWYVGAFDDDPTGEWVQADLRGPREIDRVRVVTAEVAPDVRTATRVRLRFSDGTSIPVALTERATDVRFRPRSVDSVRLTVEAIRNNGFEPVGIAEIAIGDLDLREHLQLPTDLDRAARRHPRLAALLRSAPLTYQIARNGSITPGGTQTEPDLRRRFKTIAPAEYTVTGSIRHWAPQPAASGECRGDVLRVDGVPVPVRLGEEDPATEMRDNLTAGIRSTSTVAFTGCAPVDLGRGWHTLESVPGTTVEDVALRTGPQPEPASVAAARTVEREGGRVRVRVDAAPGDRVVLGESYDEHWGARAGDRDLRAPIALDTQLAWRVPDAGQVTVAADYRPDGLYRAAVVVSALSVLGCLVLALRRRRDRDPDATTPPEPGGAPGGAGS